MPGDRSACGVSDRFWTFAASAVDPVLGDGRAHEDQHAADGFVPRDGLVQEGGADDDGEQWDQIGDAARHGGRGVIADVEVQDVGDPRAQHAEGSESEKRRAGDVVVDMADDDGEVQELDGAVGLGRPVTLAGIGVDPYWSDLHIRPPELCSLVGDERHLLAEVGFSQAAAQRGATGVCVRHGGHDVPNSSLPLALIAPR
jgi:hypothetical protein